MSRTNKLFFAIAKGQVSSEITEFKRYIGVAPVSILAVNPNKKELENIYGNTVDNDPIYTNEVEVDGKKIKQVRVDFIVKTDGDKVKDNEGKPINCITRVSFFVRDIPRFNNVKSKVQVIDKYGRTAWVTMEEYKSHSMPSYIKDSFRLDKDYRTAFWGEPELVEFIKAFLIIPNPEKWKDSNIVGLVDNPENCEIMFEHIKDWFTGNISEIKEAVNLQPNNQVRILFGVRTTDENKQYQSVFTQMFIPMNSSKKNAFLKLEKEVKGRKDAGAYSTTEFEVCDLKEYKISPTDLSSPVQDDLPFGDDENPWK